MLLSCTANMPSYRTGRPDEPEITGQLADVRGRSDMVPAAAAGKWSPLISIVNAFVLIRTFVKSVPVSTMDQPLTPLPVTPVTSTGPRL